MSWRLLVLTGVGLLYLLPHQHMFTIDSLYYLWGAEFAHWRSLLHPHHVALELLWRGWWRTWEWFGWPGRAVIPFQALNLVVSLGALGVALRLFETLARDRLQALLWWSVLAVSFLPWFYATQAEGVPLYAFFGSASLLWAAALPGRGRTNPPAARTAVALAATIVGGVAVHQSLVLWAPLLAWMLAREARPGRRLRLGALTLGLAAGGVLGCYLVAGAWAAADLSPGALGHWFTSYAEEFAGRCGSLRLLVSADVPRGLASALLTGTPLKPYLFGERPRDLALAVRLAPYALAGLIFLLAIVRTPGAWRAREAPQRRALVNVALLVLVASLFAGWWEPSNRKFWAPVLPGLLALASVGWGAIAERRPRVAGAGMALLIATIAAFNLAGGILPRHHEHDDRQPLLVFLARRTGPADAVVLREDRVWQCAVYFQNARLVHGIPGERSDRDDPEHSVFLAAVADARRALEKGATLYVAASEWPRLRTALAAELGALPEPVEALRYGDLELHGDEQILLALRLPVG
ncbi:MAG TPA: hypothetical protein PLL30_12775 [Candidatus Krumholzibacteria bacterium]|nr:hypothetical protein [Candidatus Krumholzibacteria bacterium]HPD72643.1 hypothetical protein [Candidatus Krumholzibacteria bacterium]HRY40425.1 hypothetical protein [Candidatus Krumholzibacteria bacterium]